MPALQFWVKICLNLLLKFSVVLSDRMLLDKIFFFKRLQLWNQRSYKGETHLKMTTRARAIHQKHQKHLNIYYAKGG